MTPTEALRELIDLLDDYAPCWYNEELRDRAVAALSDPSAIRWRPGRRRQDSETVTTAHLPKGERARTAPMVASAIARTPAKTADGTTIQ